MKHILHKIVAIALTLSILSTSVLATSLGTWRWQSSTDLGTTVSLSRGQFYGSYYQTENVITFSPEDGLTPVVAYGNTLYGRSTLDYISSYLEDEGLTTVAAINGSFFDLTTGIPYGAVVTDGVLRVSGTTPAVGFFADGSAIIGSPGMTLSITLPDGSVTSAHYNREMTTASGLNLFSRDYDYSTKDEQTSYNVVLKPEKDGLEVGESMEYTVVELIADGVSCDIPDGHVILAMDNDSQYQYTLNSQLKALVVGDVLTIESQVEKDWADVQYVCGGDELLVTNGVAGTSFTLDSAEKRTGRTAIGLKSDGSVVMYTVDGLQSGYSSGLTLAELATRMVELGCVTALNLDGGGSTTVSGRYLGDTTTTALNSPSDGKQRQCANFIFLTRKTTTAGDAEKLHLYPYDALVLAGGALSLAVKATDDNDVATTVPADITYSATTGSVASKGTFTAGDTDSTITAKSGSITGSVDVKVITTPSAISVKNQSSTITSLTTATAVDLSASATYNGISVTSQDSNYTWSVDGNVGSIDENGLFTPSSVEENATGTITVSAGTCQVEIPVTVTPLVGEGAVIQFMESAILENGTGVTASVNANRSYVKYGNKSGQLTYDTAQTDVGYVLSSTNIAIPSGHTALGLWVYGDNSNNSFSAQFTVSGKTENLWLTQLNFSGWKWVTATIPTGATAIESFKVVDYEEATTTSGVVYIDQISSGTTVISDQNPPVISAELDEESLTISATDGESSVVRLELYVDGQLTEFDGSWQLPTDELPHQIRIEAVDDYGNLSMETLELSGEITQNFVDMDGHWADSYVNYAYENGYLNGSETAEGTLEFRPDNAMTRQEFAVALIGFLGVDSTAYASTTLPFLDSGSVSSWASNQMKAAYALGLMTGAQESDGLYGNPMATITRQEAMVILARTQAKGYETGDLSQFADQDQVASWASSDIAIMVAQGVISGSNGNLEPNGSVTRCQVAKMLKMLY